MLKAARDRRRQPPARTAETPPFGKTGLEFPEFLLPSGHKDLFWHHQADGIYRFNCNRIRTPRRLGF